MEFFAWRYRRRDYEHPRRAFLVRALTLGLFAAGGPLMHPLPALGAAGQPHGVPPGKSIHRLTGTVSVNAARATRDTVIRPGDTIVTGADSELVFVIGKDAFMLRENSRLEVGDAVGDRHGVDGVISGLRMLSGRILSVFGERGADQPLQLDTAIATVGIRGTGLYLEAHPDRSYVCTCYGETRLQARDDPASTARVTSEQHDDPRFILAAGPAGRRIEPAPVINHTDMELILIEELVGREPPFIGSGVQYGA